MKDKTYGFWKSEIGELKCEVINKKASNSQKIKINHESIDRISSDFIKEYEDNK